MDALRQLDDRLLLAVNQLARDTPGLHSLVLGYATYGVALFGLLLLVGLVLTRHGSSRQVAGVVWAGLAALVGLVLNQPLGQLVREARPYDTHPTILRLADVTTDFSFPSDHSVMAGAVAVGLLLVSRRLGLVALVLAVLLAFSRVYIAAHYPWDVVAGLALGAAVAAAGWWALGGLLTRVTDAVRGWPGLRAIFGPTAATAPSRVTATGRG